MEQVLVVERNKLLDGKEIPHGFHKDDLERLLQNIHKFAYFINRTDAENNPALNQITHYHNIFFINFVKKLRKNID